MNDPEFRQMVNKAIFIVSVVLVFTIPLFFVFKNKLLISESNLLKDITNKNEMMIYITENNCNKCNTLKKELDKKDIEYELINKDKSKDYNKIIQRLGLDSSNIYSPTLIYIEKGELISYMVDIESKESLNDYLKNYK